MPNLLDYIHYRRTMKHTLVPALNGIRDDDWYVSLGTLLPDGSGVCIGGQDLSWPSPAHEAVWRAARYGFTDEAYDDVLRTQGFLNARGSFGPDAWIANVIAPLSFNAQIPFGSDVRILRMPEYIGIARWTWRWNWKWDTRSRFGHKICVNASNPHEFIPIPGTWAAIADGLITLSADQSLGEWILDWSAGHRNLFRKHGHIPVFYALPQLVMLLAAFQAYGAGYLDLLHGETVREADERTDYYVQ